MRWAPLAVAAAIVVVGLALAVSLQGGGEGGSGVASTVRVATLAAGFSTVDVIEDLGLGAKHGVDVRVVRLGKTPEIATALARGDVDVAIIPVEYAMKWSMDGPRLVVIAVDMYQNQAILAMDDAIDDPTDLVGRIVGAFTPTSTYNMFKTYMKILYNVSVVEIGSADEARPDAVNVVNLPPGAMVTSLTAGHVDAIVAFEPIVSEAIAAGAHVVASFGDLYAALGYEEKPVMIVYAARADWLSNNKEAVEALLKARAEAASIWSSNETYAVDLLVRLYKMSEESAKIMYERVEVCTSTYVTQEHEASILHVLNLAYQGGFLPEDPQGYIEGFIYKP